jgi:hypothetical protein
MRRKSDLPQKVCAACGRPFSWPKDWDEVKTCSDRCKLELRRNGKMDRNDVSGGDGANRA